MKPGVNLGSERARQAKLGIALSQPWLRSLLLVSYAVALAVGIWLIVLQQPSGWLLVGLAFWPVLPLIWYEWWLKDLPPIKDGEVVDDLLEAEVLGRLPANASPKQLAELVASARGGLFFMIRLGVGPNFLRDMSSADPAAAEEVWQVATKLRRDIGAPTISAAVVMAALVNVMPNRDQLLAQLQLTNDDIMAAVRWYHHLQDLVAQQHTKHADGGIGRDLSFGYANLLMRFADNISMQVAHGSLSRQLEAHQSVLDQLMQQLSGAGRHNAVLVGPTGVGKTTLVYTLAERLLQADGDLPQPLRFRQVLALDPSSLIAQARGRGDLEALLTQLLNEAYAAKNIILFLDNAEMFFSDETGSVDVRNILLPVLESGALQVIMAMDEQQWLKISRATPALAQQLNRITVPPLNEADTLLVCEDQILVTEFQAKVTYMYQALKAAYRLGSRYVADQAMPGQALKILQAAAPNATSGLVTSASVEQAVEKLFGVKVATARKTEERQTLLNLEELLHQRMVNQTRAVTAVSNALRRARSGVRNQNRPIGSFIFLGPTGVGKTELAKALAVVYFGGEDHLVRIDLNEFGSSDSVNRLIADAATDPRSLTAQIAKQPFSVVLLDEIEKANPAVLDTLLQLLDEGILRDINNREVSFRDAVVIATSNAGADIIRKHIDAGEQLEQFEEQFINQLIDNGQFKPEFLNRFDEATLFRPLNEAELMRVVELLLREVNKTLEQQHVQVTVADDAKQELVRAGNDPRLGARPLRRVVQKTVENIVAKRLLQGEVAAGEQVTISLEDVEAALQA